MKLASVAILVFAVTVATASPANAQKAPEIGYVFPPGGKAGTTVEVRLGGYDWTPDMEFFVHDKRVQLIPGGPPGPILIPAPPYWFGAKSRLPSQPLPREVPAKFVLAPDVPPGPIYWQAANANGSTAAGVFLAGAGPEIIENEARKGSQTLASLPVTVSGRLMLNEEIDQYRFTAPKDGPVTCDLMARRLGSKFLPILQVRDAAGRMIADVAGTSGVDPRLTFRAKAGTEYIVSIHDADFGGDRSYVYRLTITAGPRIMGALPAAGKRGEARDVEFIVDVGDKLESVKSRVAFPAAGDAFEHRLETPWGPASAFRFPLSDLADVVVAASSLPNRAAPARPGEATAITGVLDQPDAEDRHAFAWKKGQTWSLLLEARRIGSPLDVSLVVLGPDGKELARNDDLPETTDAGLDFTVPTDGTYQIVVSDMAGKSGARHAIYRLAVRPIVPDFTLTVLAQRISVPLGGKFDLAVKATRAGGFKGPIALSVTGLPAGITVPANLAIPADKTDLAIPLQAAGDASAAAAPVTVTGTAMIGTASVTRTVSAPTTVNLAPRGRDESRFGTLLVASVMKPRFKGHPVDKDTGRKVHRGSTFPADVIVERLEGFQGEIVLQMAATQSYQVQGITGGEVKVPPGVTKAIYPCFMPEWLETTRTSRMGMIGVAKVPDPKGKVRYLVNGMTGFITMTMEGALLKVSTEEQLLLAPSGQSFDVHLKVSRLVKLAEPVRLELRTPPELAGKLTAEPIIVPVGKEHAVVRVTPTADLQGPLEFTIRGTAMQNGVYPCISDAIVAVEFRRGR